MTLKDVATRAYRQHEASHGIGMNECEETLNGELTWLDVINSNFITHESGKVRSLPSVDAERTNDKQKN